MAPNVTNAQRAEILTQALPYIQKYNGKIVVVKYGGNAMTSEDLKQQVMEDIVLLYLIGVKIVLVHGGGPEITELLGKIGKKSEFVDGLRVTDKETVDVVQMVLAGKINKSLVNLLEMKGAKAMGISGIDGHMIEAEIKDERLGFVGKITKRQRGADHRFARKGLHPRRFHRRLRQSPEMFTTSTPTPPRRRSPGAMKAESLISMTDIAGILRDRDDPSSLIPLIDIGDAETLFREGIISGGMIPKVECSIDAIRCGVKKVIIMDGRVPHAILIETLTDEGAGTMVVADKNAV